MAVVLAFSLAPHAKADQGQDIVNWAASMAGKPYCYAGGNTSGPTHGTGGAGCPGSTVGFDCTGLTLFAVYKATGIVLPHGVGQNSRPGGTPVSRANLLPGDLVFFGSSLANYSHAGVYAGGGKMWDAADFGVPVQLHNLYGNYVGATRYGSRGGSGVGEGSFIQVSGAPEIYRIVGGAPLYVSSWNAFGGSKPTTVISRQQFDGLRPWPADGTFVNTTGDGRVYKIVGGAPIYVSNWPAVGGQKSAMAIDQWDVDNAGNPASHLRPYPTDGTFISTSGDGRVYVMAGGAPIYVSNWDAVGGPKGAIGIDKWAVDNPGDPHAHIRRYPVDGTFVGTSGDGRVYVIVGGAPTYISNWDAVGGPKSVIGIDKWAVDNPTDPHAHLRKYPADGTLVSTSGDGRVYVMAGGAPMYVSSWAGIGGARPATGIDRWAVENPGDPHAHMLRYPADGTLIRDTGGRIYRIVGGAPFYISTWSIFGGKKPFTQVDDWALLNRADPHAHLRTTPADGTIVRSLPAKTYWQFESGRRTRISAPPLAWSVDGLGLAGYPEKTAKYKKHHKKKKRHKKKKHHLKKHHKKRHHKG